VVAALELYFDPPAERRFRMLWDALEEERVPTLRELSHKRYRPHLSLVVADELEPVAVQATLDGLAPALPLALSFQYTGVFVGRVLWLGPAPTAALLAHQAEVWRRLTGGGIELWPQYAPGAWVPHSTLSMRVPRPVLSAALRRCLEVLPIEATIISAAVADHARGVLHPL